MIADADACNSLVRTIKFGLNGEIDSSACSTMAHDEVSLVFCDDSDRRLAIVMFRLTGCPSRDDCTVGHLIAGTTTIAASG
jgi:hypothetical protein